MSVYCHCVGLCKFYMITYYHCVCLCKFYMITYHHCVCLCKFYMITNMWHDHYKQLFNSVNDTDDKPYVLSYIRNNFDTTNAVVTVYDTICAIKELPNNKSLGYDGLMSEHFKHASHRLYVLMAIVLQSMMKHGFLPQQFMTTMLVPILKNKNGDIASKSNYRPIALSTVASKILEIMLRNI